MGKRLVSRTAKVLSETKKTKDKEAVAVAYEHIPRNPEEQQHGSIYAVIELTDESGHAEEIAEKIIDILHDTYYEDTEKEPLAAFEESLAKINDELADRSSEGQINWLGKLNSILGVLSGNTLHVTQAGKAEAYLYRGEHAMHITEDLSGDSINPQRTFINIASGDLTEKDKLALLTPGVFYKISKQELKTFVSDNSPKIAADNIGKLLSGENGTVKPNALLVMEMVSPESFAADEEVEEKTEIWVKEDKNVGEEIGKGVAGGTVKVFDYLGKAYTGASVFITTKAFPAAKKGLSLAKKQFKNFRKKKDAESVILSSEEKLSTSTPEVLDAEIDLDDGILEAPVEPEKEIRIKETRKKPKLLSLERFDFSFIERAKNSINNRSKRFKLPGGKFSYLYLVGAIILFIGLFSYLGYSNNVKREKTDVENRLGQANSLYEESLSHITTGNYVAASSSLESAEEIAEGILATAYFNDEARELITRIDETKDEAQRVTKNTAGLFYEFTANVTNIFANDGLIYGVDYGTASVYSVDPKAGAQATITENPALDGKVLFATLVSDRNTLVAYTENSEVYEIDLDNGEVTKQNVSGEWEQALAADSFGTNIYLLSPNEGQIYKHFKFSSGYGAATDYFPSQEQLNGFIDIAIDGSIYVTNESASVRKYTSGKLDSYTLSELPKNYTDIKGIYTSPDTTGIYLYTNNMVIKIDENGKFVAQYASDGINSIGNIFVKDNEKTIYLVSENKIYTINY